MRRKCIELSSKDLFNVGLKQGTLPLREQWKFYQKIVTLWSKYFIKLLRLFLNN